MEFMTMAQACGEEPMGSPAFVAGVDFDPSDPEEVEIVKAASERHYYDSLAAARAENARLRAWIAQLTGADEECYGGPFPGEDVD